jgi:hypothetical protein
VQNFWYNNEIRLVFFLSLMVFENQNSSQITGTLAVEMNYDLFKAIV